MDIKYTMALVALRDKKLPPRRSQRASNFVIIITVGSKITAEAREEIPNRRKHQNQTTETRGRRSEAVKKVDIPTRIKILIPKKSRSKICSKPPIQNPKRLIRKETLENSAIHPMRRTQRERAKRQNKRSPMSMYVVMRKVPPENIMIRRMIYPPERTGRIDSLVLYASKKSAVRDTNIPIPIA